MKNKVGKQMSPENKMITAWSRGASTRHDKALSILTPPAPDGRLPIEPNARFQRATIACNGVGTLILEIWCPRPLRLWLNDQPILDEPLYWCHFQRAMRAVALVPAQAGTLNLLAEFGPRPRHSKEIDEDAPSRNRDAVMAALERRFPDVLALGVRLAAGLTLPPLSLSFTPTQFHREGVTWQEIQARLFPDMAVPPGIAARNAGESLPTWPSIEAVDWPGQLHDASSDTDRGAGSRRLFVPVGITGALPPLRHPGPDARPEPELEVATTVALRIENDSDGTHLTMPVFESLGRLAPRREWREVSFPNDADALLQRLPQPVLPAKWAHLHETWKAAWQILVKLASQPGLEGGLPNAYLGTSCRGFQGHVFVWDSSFTALAYAYGWRDCPVTATVDMLYSRQMDGGYLHREHDTHSGLPLLYEPDFSPNPPLLGVVELQIARLSGRLGRLRQVYPLLCEQFAWLDANRRLPDGTFWTTGLANGLDNSPSLGEGYPDLTAQVAHLADCLGEMADLTGKPDEAAQWRSRRDTIGRALNECLWSESMQFYSTSLPNGGHNPNKVVTGFWPLWAGVVPPDRIEHLARHLKDPKSFWRHHPVPSLAADSPYFQPKGGYWRGSTWAPTNCATIKGFQRAGRLDLARELTHRHLQVMSEVLTATGGLWENYCSELSAPGGMSSADYSWATVGPIALLLEVIIGLEPDALRRRLRWTPPKGEPVGVNRYPFGPATLRLEQQPGQDGDTVIVRTDHPFTLELVRDGVTREIACPAGRTVV